MTFNYVHNKINLIDSADKIRTAIKKVDSKAYSIINKYDRDAFRGSIYPARLHGWISKSMNHGVGTFPKSYMQTSGLHIHPTHSIPGRNVFVNLLRIFSNPDADDNISGWISIIPPDLNDHNSKNIPLLMPLADFNEITGESLAVPESAGEGGGVSYAKGFGDAYSNYETHHFTVGQNWTNRQDITGQTWAAAEKYINDPDLVTDIMITWLLNEDLAEIKAYKSRRVNRWRDDESEKGLRINTNATFDSSVYHTIQNRRKISDNGVAPYDLTLLKILYDKAINQKALANDVTTLPASGSAGDIVKHTGQNIHYEWNAEASEWQAITHIIRSEGNAMLSFTVEQMVALSQASYNRVTQIMQRSFSLKDSINTATDWKVIARMPYGSTDDLAESVVHIPPPSV